VGLTVGYVRVSTEDQVEYSPEAQANRCRQFAKEHDLGAVTILRDDGWSGKNLERPAMRELVALVEADRVTDIVTWRLDRLSRDTGDIQAQTGVGYSTARHIVENRVYLGEVRLRDRWFPGIHEPLITADEWTAARRPHIPGRRRGRDVLSGRVRCGLCRRVVGVDYNERGQAIYKCRHRGRGCDLPGRSANGLHRAAVLGLRLLAHDEDLRTAIRYELDRNEPEPTQRNQGRDRTIASLQLKRRKLLDLHYDDHITAEAFADEEARLAAQIESLRLEDERVQAQHTERNELSDRFEEVANLLANIDIDTVWEAATTPEKRVLVEDLIDAVVIHADRLVVQINGAPPLLVTLAEVGLRDGGTKTSVSEGRRLRDSLAIAAMVGGGVSRRWLFA
jgi:Resolvase, N terminal domain